MTRLWGWIWTRRAYILLAMGALGGIVRVEAIARDANETAEQVEVDRNESRIAGCLQANLQTERARRVAIDGLLTLAPDGVPLPPEQQARFDHYANTVEMLLPFRDCTPAGLDAYFENPPPDPALEESP